jgi:rhamnose transport system permease protein
MTARLLSRIPEHARRDLAFAILTLVLFIAVTIAFPGFAAPRNLAGLLDDTAILIMLALGQMLVILVRGIDLSIAANLALCGMLAALFDRAWPGAGVAPVLALTLVAGGLLGAFNGLLVWKLRLPPIVVTLGTMSIYRGAIYLMSKGAWVNENEMSREFLAFPRHEILGISLLAWIALAVAAAFIVRAWRATCTQRAAIPRRPAIQASIRAACNSSPTPYAAQSPESVGTSGWRASRWRTRTSRWASSFR